MNLELFDDMKTTDDTTTTPAAKPAPAAASISAVEMTNCKGYTGAVKLEPLTAIVARNSSGKSTITDALMLAFTGWHPAHGKKGKAIMDLASGTDMTVAAVLADGRYFRRSWTMNKAGAVKASSDVPEGFEADDAALIFNPAGFLAMNDADRVATLLRLGGQTGAVTSPAVEKLRDTLDDEAGAGADKAVALTFDPFDDKVKDPGTFMELAEAELIEARKAHKRDVGRLQNTVKGLADAAAAEDAPAKIDQKDVDEASAKLQKMAEEASRLGERYRNSSRTRNRAAELSSASHWTRTDATALEQLTADFDKAATAAEAFATLRAELAGVLAGAAEPEEVEEAADLLAAAGDWCRPSMTREDAGDLLKRAEEVCMLVSAELVRLQEERKLIVSDSEQAQAMECCPTCHAEGTGWRDRLLATYEEKLQFIATKIQEAETNSKRAAADCDAATAIIEQHATCAKLEVAQQLIAADKVADDKVAALRAKIAELGEQQPIDALRTKIEELKQRKATADAMAQLGTVPTEDEVKALKAACDDLEAKRAAEELEFQKLKAGLTAWLEFGAQTGHLTRAKEELDKAKAKLQRTEELVTATREAKADLAGKIVKPLADDLRYFCSEVLPGTVKLDHGLGIHYAHDDMTRPFAALSGSERAVIAFALAAALASRTVLKIAVLDEASMMDFDRKVAFLKRVAHAVEVDGRLAQAIVIDHDTQRPEPFSGWHQPLGNA